MLHPFELSDQAVITAAADPKGKLVIFSKKVRMLLAAGSHDVIDRSRKVIGHLLGQYGRFPLAAMNDPACIRNDLAGQQFQKG